MATDKVATLNPVDVAFITGSLPNLPIKITLLTLAIVVSLFLREGESSVDSRLLMEEGHRGSVCCFFDVLKMLILFEKYVSLC